MLTQQDLQNVRGLIQEELKPVKKKLNRIEKDVHYVAEDFDEKITANERTIQKLQNN